MKYEWIVNLDSGDFMLINARDITKVDSSTIIMDDNEITFNETSIGLITKGEVL